MCGERHLLALLSEEDPRLEEVSSRAIMAAIEKSVAVPPVLLLVTVGTWVVTLLLFKLGAGEARFVMGIIGGPFPPLPPPPFAADIRGKGIVGIIPPLHIYECEPKSIPNETASQKTFLLFKDSQNPFLLF